MSTVSRAKPRRAAGRGARHMALAATPRAAAWQVPVSPGAVAEAGLLAIALLVPVLFYMYTHESFELPKQVAQRSLLQWTLIAAGAVGLARWLSHHPPAAAPSTLKAWLVATVKWPPFIVAALVLLAWSIATALSIAPVTSFWGVWYRWAGWRTQAYYVLLFLVAAAVLVRRTQALRLAAAVTVAATAASTYAIVQRLQESASFRPHSTMGNPNFVADYLALSIFITLGAGVAAASPARRALWLVALLPQFTALFFTQTRGGWLGVALGLPLFAVLLLRLWGGPWKRVLVGAVLAGVVAVGAMWTFQDAMRRAGGPLARVANVFNRGDIAVATRFILWGTAKQLWLDRPAFGWGPDMFETVQPRRLPIHRRGLSDEAINEAYDRAHNATLDGLATVGVGGMLSLASVAAVTAWYGGRLLQRRDGAAGSRRAAAPPDALTGHPLAVGLVTGLVAYWVAQQFSIETASASTLAWMVAGLLIGGGLYAARQQQRDDPGGASANGHAPESRTRHSRGQPVAVPPWGYAAGGAAALALMTLVGWWELRPIGASMDFKRGVYLAKENRPSAAVAAYERAVSLWPYEYRYWAELSYSRRFWARTLQEPGGRNGFQQALDAGDQALRLNPEHPLLWSYWGDVAGEMAAKYADPALAERAVNAHKFALDTGPERWRYWSMAGLTHLRLNRAASALTILDNAVKLYDGDWLTWSRLGDAAVGAGDRALARKAYQASLSLNGHDGVRRALEALGPG